jgi:hypothetical protein
MSAERRIVHLEAIRSNPATEFAIEFVERAVAAKQALQARMFVGVRMWTLLKFARDDGERVRRHARVERGSPLQFRHRVLLDELAHGGDEFET